MMKFGLAILAAVLISGAAQAQRISKVNGSKLLGFCSAGRTVDCDAYLSGVADAYAEQGKMAGICIPQAVTGVQMRLVVTKYLHDHPQELELPAGQVATHAFAGAFACK
jgi:hypothetical protein